MAAMAIRHQTGKLADRKVRIPAPCEERKPTLRCGLLLLCLKISPRRASFERESAHVLGSTLDRQSVMIDKRTDDCIVIEDVGNRRQVWQAKCR